MLQVQNWMSQLYRRATTQLTWIRPLKVETSLIWGLFSWTLKTKDFSDRLTWLFGHARGSQVGDHRMFNDVNYYDKQEYLDQHKYVVIETPERKLYYPSNGLGDCSRRDCFLSD